MVSYLMVSQIFVSGWNSSQVLKCLPPQYLVRFDLLSLITFSMYAQKISSSFVLSTWFTISFSKSSNSCCSQIPLLFQCWLTWCLFRYFFLNLFFLHVSQSPVASMSLRFFTSSMVTCFYVSLGDCTMVGIYGGRGGWLKNEIKSQPTTNKRNWLSHLSNLT